MSEEYTIFGYKSFFTRFLIGITGLALLIVINFSIVYYMYGNEFSWILLVIMIFLLVVFFFMIRLVKGMKYVIGEDGISIILPSGRTYFLSRNDIEKIEKLPSMPWRKGFGLKYNFFTKEIFFTTSNQNLLRISTVHGRNIVISPKYIREDIINLYNKDS